MADARSGRKYYHFVRLMGRSASHITLEVALQTRPTVSLISEEILAKKSKISEIVSHIADVIQARAAVKKFYGVVILPEGLVEFIPDFKVLIDYLNDILASFKEEHKREPTKEEVVDILKSKDASSTEVFLSLPAQFQEQLLGERDSHGNVPVSAIETERLLASMVKAELAKRGFTKFSPQTHFFGYEGRCVEPSNFDATYCYSLGLNAAILVTAGFSGYMSVITKLYKPVKEWEPCGIPIVAMFNMEKRQGKLKPVVQKALVELDGKPFRAFSAIRARSEMEDLFRNPGPIQMFGPTELCDRPTMTLLEERKE
ncbi:Pyrophosphate--fructose 6-phosphate 1-phosphotransferase [Aduncisulcus paluster]|uniref:Pyrophosphate--fructose 6-phosphate 1-phosphotransferase n=1 Tax=Aduncisulcus paluster TaxID=2918883 RepID=A0ABQ5KTA9_9EUKA|nr:Pyrophosphate--fructose 6-phosphate 1-phosphotransferase [Aduncisulcus paluster]